MSEYKSNYDKNPFISISNHQDHVWSGWKSITQALASSLKDGQKVITIECYTGVLEAELKSALAEQFPTATILNSQQAYKSEADIDAIVAPFNGGDDPIFGWLTGLKINDYFDNAKLAELQQQVSDSQDLVIVMGTGASLVHQGDLFVYADLARWEAQLRFRDNAIGNLGVNNHDLKWSLQYKRAYFNDWRICDHLKREVMNQADFILDTCKKDQPKMVTQQVVQQGYKQAMSQPFRVVPFFDPAPWGGQWMKKYCDLPDGPPNYGWCFDGVPEENSIIFRIEDTFIELPSINLVFFKPTQLLGDKVHARFGDEFPIRFDFLDTIEGGHLSFQVHPLTEYIQHHFGMNYTQDESYYILDADPGATVYLGLKEGTKPEEMMADLEAAQRGEKEFDDDKFVCKWDAKKHDHFLIPAGTCHCSGSGTMVLEISATPYIFTFKLYDWGRVGLDGLPRPINLERGAKNINWDFTEKRVEKELINAVVPVDQGEGWNEERTGLHEREFIETRRHWFTESVSHNTAGTVNMLNLIEGREAIIESPTGAFDPYILHYAETIILPASLGAYTITPHGESVGQKCATLKAFVRS